MSHYLICSITGKATSEPVISKKNGNIFDKGALEKHIDMYGTCPISNLQMTHDDYLSIKAPGINMESAPTDASKPSTSQMIDFLKQDYETASLELLSLKKYTEDLRRQLSHSLYQNDAACRVISRLMKERNDARE